MVASKSGGCDAIGKYYALFAVQTVVCAAVLLTNILDNAGARALFISVNVVANHDFASLLQANNTNMRRDSTTQNKREKKKEKTHHETIVRIH